MSILDNPNRSSWGEPWAFVVCDVCGERAGCDGFGSVFDGRKYKTIWIGGCENQHLCGSCKDAALLWAAKKAREEKP